MSAGGRLHDSPARPMELEEKRGNGLEMNILALQFSYEQILPLVLALLLIFIIPMLMRRYGLTGEDLMRMIMTRFRKQDYAAESGKLRSQDKKTKREPYQSNGRSGDLKSLVSTLLIFARRSKLGLVYPGTVQKGNKTAGLLALVVTKSEVIGLNCFGYGGTISEEKGTGAWNQHMNGKDLSFESPLKVNAAQYELVRSVMDSDGMKNIPFKVLAVFTSRDAVLITRHPEEVMTSDDLIAYLKQKAASEDACFDPEEISRKLNSHVVRISSKKSGRS